MELQPLEDQDIPLVAEWMAKPENHCWLRFGPGVHTVGAATLKLMARRDLHMLRLFTAEAEGPPIGIVALSEVDRAFKTATLWYVLGEAAYRGHGFASRAVKELLTEGFNAGLVAVNAWAVDANVPSIRVLERNQFRLIGRQRMCHWMDGRPHDRLLFDLIASEHREQP